MRRNLFACSIGMFVSTLALSTVAQGQEAPTNYISLKAGLYTPTGGFEDYKASANLELAFGRYIKPYFVLEGTAVFLHAEGDTLPGVRDTDMTSPGFLLTPRGVYATGIVELIGGVGIGVYFPRLEIYFDAPQTEKVDETATVVGAHALAAVNINVTRLWYLGVEGKYTTTGDAKFFEGSPLGMDLNGFSILGAVGIRF